MLERVVTNNYIDSAIQIDTTALQAAYLLGKFNQYPLTNYPDSRSPQVRSFFDAISQGVPVTELYEQFCYKRANDGEQLATEQSLDHFLHGTNVHGKQATEIMLIRRFLHDMSIGAFLAQLEAGDQDFAQQFIKLSRELVETPTGVLMRQSEVSLSNWQVIREFYTEATRRKAFVLDPMPEGEMFGRQFPAAWQKAQSVTLDLQVLRDLLTEKTTERVGPQLHGKELIHGFVSGEQTVADLESRFNNHTLQNFLHSARGQLHRISQ